MIENLFQVLEKNGAARCLVIADRPSGLRAFLVIDDVTLGPAVGGIRTRHYPSAEAALEDAIKLARTMTIKCALAGLPAGGGKAVVIEQGEWNRERAFERLGEVVEELGGVFRTAGDLGTTALDLAIMAKKTQYVHQNETDLASAVARGLRRAVEACVRLRGLQGIKGLRIAVQGCGAIGVAVTRALVKAGANVIVADVDQDNAKRLSNECRVEIVSADNILIQDVDIIAPCAIGGVLTTDVAEMLRAWAVCGAANNLLAEKEAERTLFERNIFFVPDVVASAGAVIEGIGRSVMKLSDRSELIDRIGETAHKVLVESRHSGKLPTEVAEEMAFNRIRNARTSG